MRCSCAFWQFDSALGVGLYSYLRHCNDFTPDRDVFTKCVNKYLRIGMKECVFGRTLSKKSCILGLLLLPDQKAYSRQQSWHESSEVWSSLAVTETPPTTLPIDYKAFPGNQIGD